MVRHRLTHWAGNNNTPVGGLAAWLAEFVA